MEGKEDSLTSSWSSRTSHRYRENLPRERELPGKQNSFRYRRNEYDWRNAQLYDDYKKSKQIEEELGDEIVYVNSDELEDFLERNCLIYIEESDSEDEDDNDDKNFEQETESDSSDSEDSTSKSYISDEEEEKKPPRILYRKLIIMEKERVKIRFDGLPDDEETNIDIQFPEDESQQEIENESDDENVYTNQSNFCLNHLFGEDMQNLEGNNLKTIKLQKIDVQVISDSEGNGNLVLKSRTEGNILLNHCSQEQLDNEIHEHKLPSHNFLKLHLLPKKCITKSHSDSKVFENCKISGENEDKNICSFIPINTPLKEINSKRLSVYDSNQAMKRKRRKSEQINNKNYCKEYFDCLRNEDEIGSYLQKKEPEEIDIWAGRESPVLKKSGDPHNYDDDSTSENESIEEIDIWAGRDSPVSRIKLACTYDDANDKTFENENIEEEIDIWAGRESPVSRVKSEIMSNDNISIEEIDIWEGKDSPVARIKSACTNDDSNDKIFENESIEEEIDIWTGRESPISRVKSGVMHNINIKNINLSENSEDSDIWQGKEPTVERANSTGSNDDDDNDNISETEYTEEIDIWAGRESPVSREKSRSSYGDDNNDVSEHENTEKIEICSERELPISVEKSRDSYDDNDDIIKNESFDKIDFWEGRLSPSARVRVKGPNDVDNNDVYGNENLEEEISIWAEKELLISKIESRSFCENDNGNSKNENFEEEIDIWAERKSEISIDKSKDLFNDNNNDVSVQENFEDEIDTWAGRESPVTRVKSRGPYDNDNDALLHDNSEETDIWAGRESPITRIKSISHYDDDNDVSEHENSEEIDIWAGRESPVARVKSKCSYHDENVSEHENSEEIDIWAGRESPVAKVKSEDLYNEHKDNVFENDNSEDIDIWVGRESPVARVKSKCSYHDENVSEHDNSEKEIYIWSGRDSSVIRVKSRDLYTDDNDVSTHENSEEADIWTKRGSPVIGMKSEDLCYEHDKVSKSGNSEEEMDLCVGREFPVSKTNSSDSNDDEDDDNVFEDNSPDGSDIWLGRESPASNLKSKSSYYTDNANISENDNTEEEIDIWAERESPSPRARTGLAFENNNSIISENKNALEEIDISSDVAPPVSKVKTNFAFNDCYITENKKSYEEIDIWAERESPISNVKSEVEYYNNNDYINEIENAEEIGIWPGIEHTSGRIESRDSNFNNKESISEKENTREKIDIWAEKEVSKLRTKPIEIYTDNNDDIIKNKSTEQTDITTSRESLILRINSRGKIDDINNSISENENNGEETDISADRTSAGDSVEHFSSSRIRRRPKCEESDEYTPESIRNQEAGILVKEQSHVLYMRRRRRRRPDVPTQNDDTNENNETNKNASYVRVRPKSVVNSGSSNCNVINTSVNDDNSTEKSKISVNGYDGQKESNSKQEEKSVDYDNQSYNLSENNDRHSNNEEFFSIANIGKSSHNTCLKTEITLKDKANDGKLKLASQNEYNTKEDLGLFQNINLQNLETESTNSTFEDSSQNKFNFFKFNGIKKVWNFFKHSKNLNLHLTKMFEALNLISGNDAVPLKFSRWEKEMTERETNAMTLPKLDSSLIKDEISNQSLLVGDIKKAEHRSERYNSI